MKLFANLHPPVTGDDNPYRWRSVLRILLPRPLSWLVGKGKDCEAVGAVHHWYSVNDQSSACYHCKVVRLGQLWKKQDEPK
jgi:hypothetical protein